MTDAERIAKALSDPEYNPTPEWIAKMLFRMLTSPVPWHSADQRQGLADAVQFHIAAAIERAVAAERERKNADIRRALTHAETLPASTEYRAGFVAALEEALRS